MLHYADHTTGLEHARDIGQRAAHVAAITLKAGEVMQSADHEHGVGAAGLRLWQAAECEAGDLSVVCGPRRGAARPIADPGLLGFQEGRVVKIELGIHLGGVVRTDQLSLRAKVGGENACVPAVAGEDLHHLHARCDAEEVQCFTRVARGVTRLDLGGLGGQHFVQLVSPRHACGEYPGGDPEKNVAAECGHTYTSVG